MVVWRANISAHLVGHGLKWLWRKTKPMAVIVVITVGVVHAYNYRKKQVRRKKWNSAEKDLVILHTIPRGRYCPNLSPFVVKLETYLRMADIKYEIDCEEPMGPKGKLPWITLNGKEMADSQLIMEELGVKYGKDFSSNLTKEQNAVSRAFLIMVDEHLYWCNCMWRWVYDRDYNVSHLTVWNTLLPFHWVYRPLVARLIHLQAWMQGVARHSQEEVVDIGRRDLEAISCFLGDKPFLMGEVPSEVDCAVFGMLSQFEWNSRGSPYLKMLDMEFQNLHKYCQRMKVRFWPDWNQCLNPPRT
ncbi:failed axon connections homolog isoform X1 [Oratosquilla oratoria]|uniref:failed axon connections homolog isoform X1 n=1 Tax=Oratosquilla oratoria TaxID=337810 RepID=UPI003F76C63C